MFDAAQILFIIVILVLTLLLLVLSAQVFLILRDLRHTIAKANKVLDKANEITENVSTPISNLSQVLMGLKTGATVAGLLKKVTSDEEEKKHG